MNKKALRAAALLAAMSVGGVGVAPAVGNASNVETERAVAVTPAGNREIVVARYAGFDVVTKVLGAGRPWPWWVAASRTRPSQQKRRRRAWR